MHGGEKRKKGTKVKKTARPVEGPGRADRRTLGSLKHDKELGLPRALRDVLDAIQNQVLQLDVPVPNAPRFVTDVQGLIRLPHRCFTLAKSTVKTLRVVVFAYLDERIHDLGDLESEFRPSYRSAGPLPVYGINL